MRFSLLTSALLFATSALASPISSPSADAAAVLETRQQSTYCGNTYYSSDAVYNAFNQGYNDYANGEQVGYNNYPHQYNNYEGFDFPVSGPYQEFPILSDGEVYTGDTSPGPDRVVFNTNGQYAGAITHTGASGNDFVGCSGTS